MFCSDPHSTDSVRGGASLRERAADALRLVGAFLTLEDVYDVHWEFPGERVGRPASRPDARRSRADARPRPTYAPRTVARRPAPPATVTPCLSPLPARSPAAPSHCRAARER